MTRALIPDLRSAHPIAQMLPAVFQEDDFLQGFVGALDSVLAQIFLTLDNIESCFDPMLAPDDFVMWLAEWVGLMLDETWPVPFTRAAVARTVDMYAWRGTVRGIREVLELYTGVVPEVIDSGGTVWSTELDPEPPGSPTPGLTVRVPLENLSDADLHRLDLIIQSLKPGHVPHQVQTLAS